MVLDNVCSFFLGGSVFVGENPVRAGNVSIGRGAPLALIAGPCVIESEECTMRTAERLKRLCAEACVPLIFKASYDKANRSSGDSFRGPGLEEGLAILGKVRRELGIPITSDVHCRTEVATAAEALDLVQIPAFLCRQTDLVQCAARAGKPVNIKKGQFMAPWDMRAVVGKAEATGNDAVMVTERGACFGYNNLVSDMRSIVLMREMGLPVVYDATHSVQLPGAQGDCSGGERELAVPLALAAVAAGCDALFIETHERPETAKCDAATMLPLDTLPSLLRRARRVREAIA